MFDNRFSRIEYRFANANAEATRIHPLIIWRVLSDQINKPTAEPTEYTGI